MKHGWKKFAIIACLTFAGCQSSTVESVTNPSETETIVTNTISVYETSEEQDFILNSYGLYNDGQMYEFHVSDEFTSVSLNVYVLDENREWKFAEGDRMSLSQQDGYIAIYDVDDQEIRHVISFDGSVAVSHYEMDEVGMTSFWTFQGNRQSITAGTEIPLYIRVTTDEEVSEFNSISFDAYSNTEELDGWENGLLITVLFES